MNSANVEREGASPIALGAGDSQCEAAIHALHGYLCITDSEACVRFMSRGTLDHGLGWFIGRAFLDLFAEDHRPMVLDALDRIRAGAPVAELEARGGVTGRWYQLRIAGIREAGQVSGFAAHALDIDDIKRSETEKMLLRARLLIAENAPRFAGGEAEDIQRRFDLIADALPVLISYVDRERRYQFNNAAYERWFLTSREELRGKLLPSVLGAAAYEQIRAYVDAALAGRPVSFELTLPYQNAGRRRVLARYVPDLASDGSVEGFYALIEDVTERREAEAALRERDDELRQLQKMDALGRLAGGIAHDFANLLHIISANCDAVLHTLPERSTEGTLVARVRDAAQRGASLTRQLLSFSRRSELRKLPLDLDGLLRDMEIVLERLLPGIVVELDPRSGALISGDAGQLQQILLNLAINARDAMPNGGRLRIATRSTELEEDAELPGTLRPGNFVVLTVSDEGTGMDRHTLARIFDPFFTTKPPGEGTGLGLSSVYGIVQQSDGDIAVESEPGRGTTFRLYFPRLGPVAPHAVE